MFHPEDTAQLRALEGALTDALTLGEGLDADELGRSRLTLRAIRQKLQLAARAMAALSGEALERMPELDAEAWAGALRAGADARAEALATLALLEGLAPATLDWLRLYQAQAAESA